MRNHIPEIFTRDVWRALYAVLWEREIRGLEDGACMDGITPLRIETNKHGISIKGSCWLLRGAKKQQYEFPLHYHLNRPRFNSVGSVSVKKIEKAELRTYSLEEGTVSVELE